MSDHISDEQYRLNLYSHCTSVLTHRFPAVDAERIDFAARQWAASIWESYDRGVATYEDARMMADKLVANLGIEPPKQSAGADIDSNGLKANFAAVVASGGDAVAQYFYSYLFLRYPEMREMFPRSMSRQRRRLVAALEQVVANLDSADRLVPYLEELGRDHRKFGVLAAHYRAVGDALITTLRHFSGDTWTDELQDDWSTAYRMISDTMSRAAQQVDASEPRWWDAEITEVDLRTFDIAVLKVRTDTPHPYRAGQSLPVELSTLRPREWRLYTPANAPGGLEIELHVRLIEGGPVSTALVRSASAGDPLRLGPPVGRLTLEPGSQRPLLLVAGGTGLAPLKSIIDQLARDGGRTTHLYYGARSVREIYDRKDLESMAARYPWLTLVIAVSDDVLWRGPRGLIGNVVINFGDWSSHDVLVCGSSAMVKFTVDKLLDSGVPQDRVRFEDFGEA